MAQGRCAEDDRKPEAKERDRQTVSSIIILRITLGTKFIRLLISYSMRNMSCCDMLLSGITV